MDSAEKRLAALEQHLAEVAGAQDAMMSVLSYLAVKYAGNPEAIANVSNNLEHARNALLYSPNHSNHQIAAFDRVAELVRKLMQ